MNISSKKLFTLILAIALVSSLTTYTLEATLQYSHINPRVNSNVYVFKDGVMIGSTYGNLITTIGEAASANAHINVALNLQAISVGNCTPSAALTQVTSEAAENGFTRVTCSQSAIWQNGGHDAINFSTTFTCVTAMETINSAGLQWSLTPSSDNNLFAVAYLTDGTAQQFPAGSTCTVTWVVTFVEHP